MEGLTTAVFRRLHHQYFGGTDLYYIPFITPTVEPKFTDRHLKELSPEVNAGIPVVPQLLSNRSADFIWAAKALQDLGYKEVNLNLGCPSGTVTAKGKGSGMLRDPVKLDAFLAAVFANAEGPISVKTRLGVEKPEEFTAILDIYNRYPICELTIHPRVMRQLYRGQADRAAFAASLPGCRMPVCYNGDVTTAADLHTLEAQYPQLSGIMIGRGFIALNLRDHAAERVRVGFQQQRVLRVFAAQINQHAALAGDFRVVPHLGELLLHILRRILRIPRRAVNPQQPHGIFQRKLRVLFLHN